MADNDVELNIRKPNSAGGGGNAYQRGGPEDLTKKIVGSKFLNPTFEQMTCVELAVGLTFKHAEYAGYK
jgi:hypothetical protein